MHKYIILEDNIKANTKHYVGFPPEVSSNYGEAILLPVAKVIILYQTPDSYILYRYDLKGEFVGDTWHETEEDAIDQVDFEFSLNHKH